MNQSRKKKMERILITGATGFIGRHLCARLLKEGYLIRALVRPSSIAKLNLEVALEQFEGDLLDAQSLTEACKDIDFVVHLAGVAHVPSSSEEHLLNIDGTKLLLASAVENKVKRFLLMSSSLASIEEKSDRAITSYGETKLAAEKILMSEHRAGNLEGVVLRPANIYGPGMRGNIAKLISMISKGTVIPLPTLETRISLTSVQDVCEAVALAMKSKKASGSTYVLTDGQKYPINRIEREIYQIANKKMPSWRPPRLLLYILIQMVVMLDGLFKSVGIKIGLFSGVSMRTYHNLVNDSLFENNKIKDDLGFESKTTFYSSLPDIFKAIN